MEKKKQKKSYLNEISQTGSNPHTELVNDILVAVSALVVWRVWKQHVGFFIEPYSGRKVHVGKKGQADIGGISPTGKILQIECKTGNATQTAEQKAWEKMITERGGYYLVARSVEDAVRFCCGHD